MDWFSEIWESLTWSKIAFGAGIFILSFMLSALAVGIVMVKIPANYFSSQYTQVFLLDKPWIIRWGVVILKNALGILLIIVGIILSLPGIPGQGLLTILLGLIMLDIPGKRPLEARIIKRPAIRSAINNLRARYNKPPLVLD